MCVLLRYPQTTAVPFKYILFGEMNSFLPSKLLFPFCFVSPLSILRSAKREKEREKNASGEKAYWGEV